MKQLHNLKYRVSPRAATFGWLCVETRLDKRAIVVARAATFGWLCVETEIRPPRANWVQGSHLRVAVC